MDFRQQRLAQIVRDFMEAYALSAQLGSRLRQGDLRFDWVERLVGDSEGSALFRLKEECHALFRFDKTASREELQAEELFDLAVGALFHEAMKFREGYYVTTTYGPRLERMMRTGSARGPLAEAFSRVIAAGRQRMTESAAEVEELFDETRHQLVVLLAQIPPSGPVARSLVADPVRTQHVFGVPVGDLLGEIYGSHAEGYWLAVEDLTASGHFAEAAELLDRTEVRTSGVPCEQARTFALGMDRHYEGDPGGAVSNLRQWIESGANGPTRWRERALHALGDAAENADLTVGEHARRLAAELSSRPLEAAATPGD
jgi:hypothetical protein